MLTKHPLVTKMVTSGLLSGFGDLLCQGIEGKKTFNFKRTATFSFMGLIYIGPMLPMNYSKILPTLVPIKGSATIVALKKLCLD